MTALVLSGSYQETNRFANQMKLGYGIRHIVSKDTIRGMRPTSIHILPSFRTRRDYHAVNAELKHVLRSVRNAPVTEYVKTEDGWMAITDDVNRQRLNTDPAPDTSPGAVPGQTAIEEHLGKDEFLARLEAEGVLEPEGFELSDDPDVQARQILESAAHFAEPEPAKKAPAKPRKPKAPKPAPEPAEDLPDWMTS